MNRCLKCGHDEVKFRDCGYSTFNPGHATCAKCGRDVDAYCDSLHPEKDLAIAWNKANPKPKDAIAEIEKKIQSLKEEKVRIEGLFKKAAPCKLCNDEGIIIDDEENYMRMPTSNWCSCPMGEKKYARYVDRNKRENNDAKV